MSIYSATRYTLCLWYREVVGFKNRAGQNHVAGDMYTFCECLLYQTLHSIQIELFWCTLYVHGNVPYLVLSKVSDAGFPQKESA